jgi:hypothetical protein
MKKTAQTAFENPFTSILWYNAYTTASTMILKFIWEMMPPCVVPHSDLKGLP